MKQPKSPLLTRRTAHRVMPLEARLMFDAAAAADASRHVDAPVVDAPRAVAPPTQAAASDAPIDTRGHDSLVAANTAALDGLARQGLDQALAQVNALLARLPAGQDFSRLVADVFGHTGTDAATFNQRLTELSNALAAGGLNLKVELRSPAELQGAYAAYAAHAPDGSERIYLNAEWVARGASQADIARVLLEEVGHAIDQRLNAGVDTPGDEGERFSALVRGESVGELRDRALLADADQGTLTIDGSHVDVEFAELSVPFSEGFIGTQGSSNNKADGILNFATLGIVRASFYQDAGGNAFTAQGNDIPGGVRLTLSSGRVITVTGAINWRVTQGSTLYCFGFIPDPATTPVSFTYGSNSTFTISNTSNFGLELVGVNYSAADNSSINGNAATNGLLTALNGYLSTVQANDPNGPVTVNTLTTTSTTPTLTGSVTLGGGESLSVMVNGVTYTTGSGLSVGSGSWSLSIPNGNALTSGTTYSVTATIINGSGYTLTDTSTNELVIQAPDTTAPVVGAGQSYGYAENQTAGTTIATVTATDAVGVTGYRFGSTGTATSSDGYYSINASGQISLTSAGAAAAANDYETLPNSFTHAVQAGDAAGNWSSAVNVTFNVTDVDDTAPVVTASQSFSYAENQSAGTTLGTVSATDAVGVTGYRFSSTGTTTSADGFYSINASGQVSLTTAGAAAATNDYETLPNSFTYGVQARDAAGNWSGAVNVTFNVTDVDDTAPVVAASQSFNYAENQTVGTTLGTVSASDAVGVTGYRFSGTGTTTSADGFYNINASGQVSLTTAGAAAATNDYETLPNSFTYGVQARDAAGNWSSAVNVTFNVTDVDDTAPVVAASQSFSYAENQTSGTTLGTVSATDAVGVTGYRFSSTGTTTSADGFYSINASGQVSLTNAGAAAATNDYETLPNSFTYGVQARDAAGNWSSAVNVTLNVTDVDDTAPVVASSQSFSYAENQAAGTTVGTVSASDAVGVTGYRFSSTGTTTSADGFYSINASGQVSLTTAGAAAATNDYETLPNSFTYGVQARDAAGNWSSAVNVTFNVTDVDDTAPVVTASQSFSYAENQTAGATLGTVSATDAVGVTGFRFSSTGTTTSADGFYSINASGQVSLTSAGAAAAANDFETLPNSFTHAVQAGDAAGNWSSAVNITLNVSDVNESLGDSTPPVVASGQSFSYAENQSVGSVIGTVSATDTVGVTGYRFGSTGTATSSDGYYSINASGQISLTSAGAAAAANDYETLPNSFTHAVQAGDAAGNWSNAVNVTFNVTDVDDTAPVVAASQSFSYAENQTSGTTLGTVSATDAVGVTGYRFSSTGTTTSADGFYSINASGQVSLTNAGAAAATNDYETLPNSFTYGVQARDAAGNWSSAVNVTLNVTDVDDTAPVVASSQSFSYAENQTAGTALGTVSATDAVGVTGFRFSSTGTTTSADGFYSINASGQVSLTTAGAAASSNDYETLPNSFTHSVQARDAAGNWSSAVNVTLNVTDVDDTAPVVAASQSFSYAENQTAGATLGTVSATDAVGVTGFRFSSTGTTTSADGFYSINASGQISLTSAGAAAAANDYETLPNSFTYGVQARDAAGNWSTAVNVTLGVTDVNETQPDSTPPIVAPGQSLTYEENRSAGVVLGTVTASDAVGVNSYRFASTGTTTSADGFYSIDASGQISLTSAGAAAAANDYETLPNSFTHAIQAGDAAGNWSNAVNLTLTVTDIDDTAPVVAANQSFSYAENQTAGTTLATVSAGDAVAVTAFRFSDTATTTSADGFYRIDAGGRISLTTAGASAAANDHETLPNSFSLGVQARDAAGNWSAVAQITLAVTDVNENTVAPDRLQVAEDTPARGNVLGNDAGGPSSVVSFTVNGSTVAADSTLDLAGVGSITIAANGDFVFVPRPDWHGTVPTITYTTDHGQASVLELVVSPVNDSPALNPDALTTFQGVPWEGRLPPGTDADGDTLAYSLAEGPQHGTVTLASDGQYRYTPDAGYAGTDRFRVEVSDGQGGSARVWVDVTVEPSPTLGLPAASDLGVSNTDRTTSADVITLSGGGTPGQALQLYDPAGRLVASTVVDANGQWSVAGIDMRTTRGDSSTAAAGAPGAYTFTLRAALPGGTLSAPVQFTVQREIAVAAAPAEPAPAPAPEAVAHAPVAAPEAALLPPLPRASFDSALPPESRPDGQLVVARAQDATTQNALSLPVRDANVADIYTRPSGFQIMVNPSPEPSLKLFRGLDDQVAKLGGTVHLQVPADTFIHTNINETVVLQATLADGRPLPRWLQFDGRTGTLSGEVPAEWRDDVVIRVMARDSQGREASTMMRLKVSAGQATSAGLSRQLMQGHRTTLGLAGRATLRT